MTPESSQLHNAISLLDYGQVKKLLSNGADPNGQSENTSSPLHRVAWLSGNAPFIATALLEAGARLDCKDYRGRTPLHISSNHNRISVSKIFLDNGADPNATDNEARTPLHLSVGQSTDIVDLLLRNGADIDAPDYTLTTPLHLAVQIDSIDNINNLISKGASICALDKDNKTPWQYVDPHTYLTLKLKVATYESLKTQSV